MDAPKALETVAVQSANTAAGFLVDMTMFFWAKTKRFLFTSSCSVSIRPSPFAQLLHKKSLFNQPPPTPPAS